MTKKKATGTDKNNIFSNLSEAETKRASAIFSEVFDDGRHPDEEKITSEIDFHLKQAAESVRKATRLFKKIKQKSST